MGTLLEVVNTNSAEALLTLVRRPNVPKHDHQLVWLLRCMLERVGAKHMNGDSKGAPALNRVSQETKPL